MKKQINIFDILALGILLAAVLAFGASKFVKPKQYDNQKVAVTIRVPAEGIENAASSQKTVYFNSVNAPVSVKSVTKDGDFLLITLDGPGQIGSSSYYFNGQRILVGQKVEVHSTYFAQGKIISVNNEN